MTASALRRTAVVGASATAVSGIAVFWLAAKLPALGAEEPARSVAAVAFVLGMVILAGTGSLLVRSAPRSVIGWLLVGTGLSGVLGRLMFALAVLAHDRGHSAATALGWMANWSWLPMQGLALVLLLRFPAGHLPGPAWRAAERLVVAWTVATMVVTALLPGPLGAEELAPRTNPLGVTGGADPLGLAMDVLFSVQPLLLLVAVAAPVRRWLRGDPDERRELAVVAAALLLLAVAAPLAMASDTGSLLEGVAWLVLPLSIAYAVVRHGLWDLDLRRRFDRLRLVRQEERARLQRELHDSLGPMLGSITMRVEAARNLINAGAPAADVDRVLSSIGGDTENAVVEVRRLIEELGPSALADGDLVTALEQLAADYREAGLDVVLTVPADLPAVDAAAEIALYRVAGEALRNVLRHARASACHVSISVDGSDVVLDVVDDGVGLGGQPAGVGRRAMADRVADVGGQFALHEPVGGGVHVGVRLAGVLG